VAGGWRRLHNEELHNLYASANIIRVIKSRIIRWTGHVARTGRTINTYKDNNKMDLKGIGIEGVEWMHLD
jgi:hypothetical protein